MYFLRGMIKKRRMLIKLNTDTLFVNASSISVFFYRL